MFYLPLTPHIRRKSPTWCKSGQTTSRSPAMSLQRTASMPSTPTRSFRRSASASVCMIYSGLQRVSSVMELVWSTSMVCLPSFPQKMCFMTGTVLTLRLKKKTVEFRLIVFRPFKGETLFGRISSSNNTGINSMCLPGLPLRSKFEKISSLTRPHPVRTEFFEDIFIPFTELPENTQQ